jgi:hypothetical protein
VNGRALQPDTKNRFFYRLDQPTEKQQFFGKHISKHRHKSFTFSVTPQTMMCRTIKFPKFYYSAIVGTMETTLEVGTTEVGYELNSSNEV